MVWTQETSKYPDLFVSNGHFSAPHSSSFELFIRRSLYLLLSSNIKVGLFFSVYWQASLSLSLVFQYNYTAGWKKIFYCAQFYHTSISASDNFFFGCLTIFEYFYWIFEMRNFRFKNSNRRSSSTHFTVFSMEKKISYSKHDVESICILFY